jgi:hypothetical protein
MVSPVSSATQIQPQPVVQPAASARPPATPAPPVAGKPQPAATDTVTISPAAKALQELTETSVQTGQEARGGDVQAQKLLAKEAADAK